MGGLGSKNVARTRRKGSSKLLWPRTFCLCHQSCSIWAHRGLSRLPLLCLFFPIKVGEIASLQHILVLWAGWSNEGSNTSGLSEGELHWETGRGEVDETIKTAENQVLSSRPQRERRSPARLAEYIIQGLGDGIMDGTVYWLEGLSNTKCEQGQINYTPGRKSNSIVEREGADSRRLRGSKSCQELIQLQTGQGCKQTTTEEWLEIRTKVEETLDKIDAYLELQCSKPGSLLNVPEFNKGRQHQTRARATKSQKSLPGQGASAPR